MTGAYFFILFEELPERRFFRVGPDNSQVELGWIEDLLGYPAYVFRANLLDLGEELGRGHEGAGSSARLLAVQYELARVPVGDVVRAFKLQKHSAANELLYFLQLVGAHQLACQALVFLEDDGNGFLNLVHRYAGLGAEIAGIGIGFGAAADVIAEAVALAQVQEEAGAHRAAKDG